MRVRPDGRRASDGKGRRWLRPLFVPVAAATMALLSLGAEARAQAPPALALPPAVTPPGGCAPATLTRMMVRDVSPGLAAAAARAQPRVIYRQGPARFRIEEQPDPTRGGETRLTIVSEPDIWTIDLASRSGQHAVDPGPTYDVIAPILPVTPDMAALLRSLQYGCEAAFVATNAAQAVRTTAWGSATAAMHVVTVGEESVALLMDSRRQTPLMISFTKQGRVVFVVRYDEFRDGLPDRPDLFAPPKGVLLGEAPRSAPPTDRP